MTNSPLQYPETYNSEDIQQIIQIALARKGEDDELTRQQLWEIASELDIDPKTIQAAEQDWLERKKIDENRHAFDLFRRDRFKQKLIKYVIINSFLLSINFLMTGAITWSVYILLFWGLGVAFQGWNTFQSQGEKYEREFQKWMFRHEVNKTLRTFWVRLQKAWNI
ncbi:MAG: 2TM domain-containing protein [Xenococcaceae cyanobacterium MO_207.B15]|nr:2TM domain-containing protein [Xenococcaceae cyanobacterium MO_207.B15]MDJ0742075.1 2TM domain-containing protein [Xenococcaceae cyanobacterium MO_167.B27]